MTGKIGGFLPLELEVLKVKEVQTKDTSGTGDPKYKFRLDPSPEEMSAFWTTQVDDEYLEPGKILTLEDAGMAQSTIEDAADDGAEEDDGEE